MINDFYNQPFPTLVVDDQIILREQQISDAEDFFHYYLDPEVHKYILATSPRNIEEARQEIDYCQKLFTQKRGAYWAIVTQADNRMIGAVGLYINNFHHRAELCYDLSRAFWRQKIMTRVINRVLSYAFLYIGIHRMEAVTTPTNQASMNILLKLGFDYEGRLKNYRYFQNTTHDVEMFGMTPTMYFSRNASNSRQIS